MALTEGPVPLYHQLASDLRKQISKGVLKAGETIPSEDRLCEQYGVSRITVRRAIDDLIAEKLLLRRRGVGTFVTTPSEVARSVSLVGSLYDALDYPENIAIEVLSSAKINAPKRIANHLSVIEGKPIFELNVMSRVNGTPFATTNFYLPIEVGAQIELKNLGRGSPIAKLVEHIIGEAVTRAEQTVEPVSAPLKIAKLLNITRGTAILHVLRTYYTASGIPVEVASVHYRPDQYCLRVELLAPNT